jgi:hypothetical protein
MRTLALSLGFVGWVVVYTAFSIWLTLVISRHQHPAACGPASQSTKSNHR